ncbi:hypothetical protein METBIDRAFT_73288 [Metschnikowia bicuspidata var. bicuspidata NRRL YB-4993]|uniref:Uncharacterized protein n=1 Tax=Metschnikowia bicuspidata var. bicuspidata NRRL YB-4993 TaxID=869754 RepID=A0A1A0H8C6_9ASCO|nr:hypothetical protein METBIDRAFT_73288 [Metschnikowia bicuspidata var. bicuspidata NRRL YB-4993]OBA20142.1 hypothetical protein METBIDRAFT_73288 [Metschnikowia bicuspidata var. bicuspidata NRRL YB-4993]
MRVSQVLLGIFILTIPLSLYGANYRSFVVNSSFLQKLNLTFITDYGILWFSGVYWGLTICECLLARKAQKWIMANKLSKYLFYLSFAVFFNVWCFGKLLVERLNIATGGHCSDSNTATTSMSECQNDPLLLWVNGFDLSGHYYFLTTLIVLLTDATSWVKNLGRPDLDFELSDQEFIGSDFTYKLRTVLTTLKRLSSMLIVLWIAEFIITSVFFHTTWEKAAGLLGIPIAWAIIFFADKVWSAQVTSEIGSEV